MTSIVILCYSSHSPSPHLHHLWWSSQRPLPSVRLLRLPSSQPPPQSCKWCRVGGRSECGRCHCRQVGWQGWSHLGWSGTQWRSSTWDSRLTRWHSKWWQSCLPRSCWRWWLQRLGQQVRLSTGVCVCIYIICVQYTESMKNCIAFVTIEHYCRHVFWNGSLTVGAACM